LHLLFLKIAINSLTLLINASILQPYVGHIKNKSELTLKWC